MGYKSRVAYLADAERLVLDEGKTWKQAAAILGIPKETVRSAVRNGERWKAGERSKLKTVEHVPANRDSGNEYKTFRRKNADGTIESIEFIELWEGEELSDDDILRFHKLDPEKWELYTYTNNLWHAVTGEDQGNRRKLMYQSKLTARPKKQALSLDDVKQTFRELALEYERPPVMYVKREGRMLAEVNIADLHLGKLCWHGDTGNNYDHKIARDTFNRIVSSIYRELKGLPIELVYFIITNDFWNSDNPEKTTTAGTPQDTDVRWQKLYKVGTTMLTDATGLMMEIAPTENIYTASNHDLQTMYYAMCHLEAFFRNDKDRLTVDTDARARKYRLYGSTLLGYTHGDTERKQARSALGALAALPPIEARELWGQSKRCEVHAAHLHCEQSVDEVNGVIVRRISSPTATDTWHYQSGYVGAVRKAQTFIYDRDYGLIHTINTPVEAVI
ncbi:MAG TPA: hypothetical protein P5244_04610 [Syntrophales bacterium]|nr:hypothetical protein [Syntrophales bacterium]HRV28389.1 hypothetical protein [Spirochaetia bacterium]